MNRRPAGFLAALGWIVLSLAVAHGQLAFTEVMTSASTNHGSEFVMQGPDFFELTNFGTNNMDLTGYGWGDRGTGPMTAPFAGVVIHPGESVIFFRQRNITTAEGFRQWWGLSESVQVIPWGTVTGLSSVQERVRLWDAAGLLVDSVDVGEAIQGVTFSYDPNTGVFGTFSVPGRGCAFREAFRAVASDDIGSPGCAASPVQPYVVEQPASLEVDQCQEATFTIRAGGMPRSKFQWLFNGTNLAGATSATLTITNAQPRDAGPYRVVVHNFVGTQTSQVAALTVTTTPRPPVIVQPPRDTWVYSNQTASFTVGARGFPCLSYQWRSNGVAIPGATNRTLIAANASPAQSGTWYSVEVRNDLGATNAFAQLLVPRRPNLRFTEVMPYPSTNGWNNHQDWFELTNFDTDAVSLLGWKVFDTPSLEMPLVITQAVTIQPGQSVIFVKHMTPAEFVAWWGASNLPSGLPIISYAGFGLSEWGDSLNLWNPAVTDPLDAVARVSFWSALMGVSMYWRLGDSEPRDSVLGVDGAVQTVESGDIGSPGYSPGSSTNSQPHILSHPAGQVVLLGQQAVFQVTAAGRGPWTCQWQFNDTDMPGATTDTLLVGTATTAAAGLYRVTVSNGDGVAPSRDASLSMFAYRKTSEGTSEFLIWGPGLERYRLDVTDSLQSLNNWQPLRTNTAFVPVNTAPARVLARLPSVDDNLAQAIIAARAGPDGIEGTADDMPFRSPPDLLRVAGMTPAVLGAIAPYVTSHHVSLVMVIDDRALPQRFYRLVLLEEGP